MTLSPSSTWGVKVGLCLPRRRIATIEASRPTMSPLASISTHFFSMSAAFAEYVFMASSVEDAASYASEARLLHGRSGSVNALCDQNIIREQCDRKKVI